MHRRRGVLSSGAASDEVRLPSLPVLLFYHLHLPSLNVLATERHWEYWVSSSRGVVRSSQKRGGVRSGEGASLLDVTLTSFTQCQLLLDRSLNTLLFDIYLASMSRQIDDASSAVTYSGNWGAYTNRNTSNSVDGTFHQINNGSGEVQVTFTGELKIDKREVRCG